MVPTCDAIQGLADRIERAYLRTRPRWRHGCSNPGVWSAAAAALVQLNRADPSIPVDPELYVAAQPGASPLDDPWQVLTQATSALRYRRRVRSIVRRLAKELRGEVDWAEGRLRLGTPIESILRSGPDRLSPLGRIIIASRANRLELVAMWWDAAHEQHASCPLYRHACRGLLPDDDYPAEPVAAAEPPPRRQVGFPPRFSTN